MTILEAAGKIVSGDRLVPPGNCPEVVTKVLGMCWRYKPEDRISMEDILIKLAKDHPRWESYDVVTVLEKKGSFYEYV